MHDYWRKCLGQRLSSPSELGGIPRVHLHRVKGSLVIILLRTVIYGFLNCGCRWLESKFGLLLFTRVQVRLTFDSRVIKVTILDFDANFLRIISLLWFNDLLGTRLFLLGDANIEETVDIITLHESL